MYACSGLKLKFMSYVKSLSTLPSCAAHGAMEELKNSIMNSEVQKMDNG